MFCPLECEEIRPSTRCHEYPSGLIPEDVGLQVNVTSLNAKTVELAGVAATPVSKITFICHSNIDENLRKRTLVVVHCALITTTKPIK